MSASSTRTVIAPATVIFVASFALLISVMRVILNIVSVINPGALVPEFEPVEHVPARWLIPGVVGLLGWVAIIGFAITVTVAADGRIRQSASRALAVVAATLFVLLFGGVVPGSSHELGTAGVVLVLAVWCALTARSNAHDNLLHGAARRG